MRGLMELRKGSSCRVDVSLNVSIEPPDCPCRLLEGLLLANVFNSSS